MTAQVRRTRSDTVNGIIQQFADAQADDALKWDDSVLLPDDATERAQALEIFSEMLQGRNREHWKPHHSRLLSETALISLQISKLTKNVVEQGAIVEGRGGYKIRSLALDALSMLQSLRTQNFKSLDLIGNRASLDTRAAGAARAKSTMAGRDDLLAS